MRNLFNYYIKKRFSIVLIITIICLVIATISLNNMNFVYTRTFWVENLPGYGDKEYIEMLVPDETPLALISVFAAILATIIPLFEFYFKMRKINVDQMYSLPIKRNKLFCVKYIVGLAEIIIPITITYLYCVLWVVFSKDLFDKIYFLPFYFSLIFVSITVYTIISFIYTRANTFFDGLILIVLYLLILPFLMISVDEVFRTDFWSYSFFYSPYFSITRIFDALLKHNGLKNTPYYSFDYNNYMIYAIVLNFITAIGAGVLFFYLNPKDKAENAFEKSNSLFAYKVIVPVIAAVSAMAFSYNTDYIMTPIIIIIGYLLLAIYHRSFKVPWKELIITIGIVLIFTFMSIAIDNIDIIDDKPIYY